MIELSNRVQNGFKLRARAYMLFAFVLLLLAYNAHAGSPAKSFRIKAGFLLQFTSYVEWPSSKPETITLCILGEDPFGNYIDQMLEARPTNRSGKLVEVHRPTDIDGVAGCEIVFSSDEAGISQADWRMLRNKGEYLLVSDSPVLFSQGGGIRLYSDQNRIRLEVDLSSIQNDKVAISSELLRIAKVK